jgi:UDP-N-acetyl-D-mannosaminuronic acid dehydrogenase
VNLDKALGDSDAVLIINDHPDYREIQVDTAWTVTRPLFVYDSWHVLEEESVTGMGVRYASLGYLAATGAAS